MRTLELFYKAAEEAFLEKEEIEGQLQGQFQGIKVGKDGNVYFLHSLMGIILKETIWADASAKWEGIYRSLRNPGASRRK